MRIREIALRNWRNLASREFEFHPSVTQIVGPNASGKTSLLEAVSYLSVPRSFLGSRDHELATFGSRGFGLRGETERGGVPHTISITYQDGKKRITLDGRRVSRWGEILRAFVVMEFWPGLAHRLVGPPEERRRFFDRVLSVADPQYLSHLVAYRRALREKNAALRAQSSPRVWNREMERHGAYLIKARKKAIAEISGAMARLGPFGVVYRPNASLSPGSLDARAQAELRRGFALWGPHRDDYRLLLGERDLIRFGSSGERTTMALILVLACSRFLAGKLGEEPVLLLDEPFSILDPQNAARVIRGLGGQVIITGLRPQELPGKVIRLGD